MEIREWRRIHVVTVTWRWRAVTLVPQNSIVSAWWTSGSQSTTAMALLGLAVLPLAGSQSNSITDDVLSAFVALLVFVTKLHRAGAPQSLQEANEVDVLAPEPMASRAQELARIPRCLLGVCQKMAHFGECKRAFGDMLYQTSWTTVEADKKQVTLTSIWLW